MPPAIQSALRGSGIFNTSAPAFRDDGICKFVAVFDALVRVNGKGAGMFLSRGGCRQGYAMPVKFKTPNVRGKKVQCAVKIKQKHRRSMRISWIPGQSENPR